MKKTLSLASTAVLAATLAQAATMEELDTNADGMVTFDEIQAAMPDVTEEVFTLADANQDGMIDVEEYNAAQETGLLPAS